MRPQTLSWAMKRYLARFLPTMALYVVVLSAVVWTFQHHPPAGWAKYLLAAAPALPLIGVVVVMGLYLIEERDEFLRETMVQAMLISIGVTLAITTVWGFLETYAGVSRMPGYSAFVIFCLALGPARPLAAWRYR